MAEDGSTAQILASGSQDLAALAGLFATEGVERNALAGHLGYGAVISSGISILGILGLVKSSVKLSLGLDRCRKSGFSIDSLRGVFGYEGVETPVVGDMVRCDFVNFEFGEEEVVFTKTAQWFDTFTRPITTVGSRNKHDDFENKTAIVIGNRRHETLTLQKPWIAALITFLSLGLTSWLLVIAQSRSRWELWLACSGLHVSLLVLVGAPLWHSFQIIKPCHHATKQRIDMLTRCTRSVVGTKGRLFFTQVQVKGGRAIYFHGDTSFVDTLTFKFCMVLFSALCATSYVCQYTVLKSADSRSAATWIGAQAALALFRVLIWLWDPAFDDPNVQESHYALINNACFAKFQPLIMAKNLPMGQTRIRRWAFDYLQENSISDILRKSCDSDLKTICNISELWVFGIDPKEIFRGMREPTNFPLDNSPVLWRIVLERETPKKIKPIVFVGRSHRNLDFTDPGQWAPADRLLGGDQVTRFFSHRILYISPINPAHFYGVGDLSCVKGRVAEIAEPDTDPQAFDTIKQFHIRLFGLRNQVEETRQFPCRWYWSKSDGNDDTSETPFTVEDSDEIAQKIIDGRERDVQNDTYKARKAIKSKIDVIEGSVIRVAKKVYNNGIVSPAGYVLAPPHEWLSAHSPEYKRWTDKYGERHHERKARRWNEKVRKEYPEVWERYNQPEQSV